MLGEEKKIRFVEYVASSKQDWTQFFPADVRTEMEAQNIQFASPQFWKLLARLNIDTEKWIDSEKWTGLDHKDQHYT